MPHLFRSAESGNRYYTWFFALHTRVDVLLIAPQNENEFHNVEEAILAELTAVERMGNRFNLESELSQAVATATVRPFHLSSELYALLGRCLQANRETGGLFDITVNSPDFTPGLINAVEITSAISSLSPSEATVPEASASGYLRLHRPGIILDLSGILKGYALERLRSLLSSVGITDALINLGNSSILSLGNNPSDIPASYCLTTSGNNTSDRRHIRNPLTGEYIEGRGTVSVTTRDAIEGEIQSTIQFIQQQ